jgi:LPXTG-motif cell wall-anchored protein
VTGANGAVLGGAGVVLVIAGALVYFVTRRRRIRFNGGE